MDFPTKDDIIQINELTIEEHGGNFVPPCNFLNENSLDYMLEAVNADLFGQPMYPSVSAKAAFYMFSIVTGHIFQDGNKRTGLATALLFLSLNGCKLHDELSKLHRDLATSIPAFGETANEILENFTIELASGQITIEDCTYWFNQNICDDNPDSSQMFLNDAD